MVGLDLEVVGSEANGEIVSFCFVRACLQSGCTAEMRLKSHILRFPFALLAGGGFSLLSRGFPSPNLLSRFSWPYQYGRIEV